MFCYWERRKTFIQKTYFKAKGMECESKLWKTENCNKTLNLDNSLKYQDEKSELKCFMVKKPVEHIVFFSHFGGRNRNRKTIRRTQINFSVHLADTCVESRTSCHYV